ncbi:riboflavin kinase [Vibrio ishigakensis]|uniref:FAD synthase n=1 Tax=Vibrio ishigakensis TaxID=1481914 RepID=A0A0B8PH20_9VIBR|nr:riboflavin kinase [Vibrio ishigakensis]
MGHQTVLKQVKQKAKQLGLAAVVMTFEPQPLELFMRQKAPARLTRLRDKFVQLSKLDLDRLLCINFNKEFAQLPAKQFVEKLLIEQLGVKYLVVGDDFRFGKDRQGDFAFCSKRARSMVLKLSVQRAFV